MKDYLITYTHALGSSSIQCFGWEIAAIMRNMLSMAAAGHQFSNVTIGRI